MPLLLEVLNNIERLEGELEAEFKEIDKVSLLNQAKVLEAFQQEKVGMQHFHATSGYGYHDLGRETLEKIFARVFRGEAALVRQQIVSGTHAIACAILGNLSINDELIIASGYPYETLMEVLGITTAGYEFVSDTAGFKIRIIPLKDDDSIDQNSLQDSLTEKTKMVMLQRSCGYSQRASLSIAAMEKAIKGIKQVNPEIAVFVDNCYGEFVELAEPTEVGADLIAGSLIKNPGGCLIPTGGYIVGQEKLVQKAAERLYAPKIGGEIGPSLLDLRIFYQGFFEAPHRVGEMLKGAVLAAQIFSKNGYQVSPIPEESRTDIIQRITLNSEQELIDFCRIIQSVSPVEANLLPEPAPMPGYKERVIMGGGTFVAGSTSEFSADAPLTPPYTIFLQGGLSYTHIKLSLVKVFQKKIAK